MQSTRTRAGLHKNDVPIERVQPMVQWLHDLYGDTAALAEAMGVAESTVEKWVYGVYTHISPRNAELIAQFVLKHRRPRDVIASLYENDGHPRLAVTQDKRKRAHMKQWRPAQMGEDGTR